MSFRTRKRKFLRVGENLTIRRIIFLLFNTRFHNSYYASGTLLKYIHLLLLTTFYRWRHWISVVKWHFQVNSGVRNQSRPCAHESLPQTPEPYCVTVRLARAPALGRGFQERLGEQERPHELELGALWSQTWPSCCFTKVIFMAECRMNYRRWGRERNKESNAIMESPEERCHRHEQGRCQWRRKRGIRIWELFINRTRGLECVKENKKGEREPWKNRPDDSWHRLHPAPQVHFLPSFVWVFHKQDLVISSFPVFLV